MSKQEVYISQVKNGKISKLLTEYEDIDLYLKKTNPIIGKQKIWKISSIDDNGFVSIRGKILEKELTEGKKLHQNLYPITLIRG